MLDLGALRLSVIADTDEAKKNLNGLKDTVSQAGESMTKMGGMLTKAVTLPIVGLATVCIKTASDVQEGFNKMNAVFGSSSDEVNKWSDSSAQSFGMSKNSFMDYVSTFGGLSQDLLKMNEADSAEFSKSIIQRSADISSYYNMTIDESNSLMQQLYSGETEGWKKLGITINDTTMQEYALSKGITQTVSDMSLQEKTALRIEMAMDKTNRAEGDFAKTKDGLANSSRILKAELSDLSVVIGTALLPTVNSIVSGVSAVVANMVEWSKANPELVDILLKLAGALALVAPMLLGVGMAIKLATSMGSTMALVFSPVGAIIAGVIAVVALLAVAWQQNLGGIQDKTKEAFGVVLGVFQEVAPQLQEIFKILWDTLKSIWETVGKPIFSALGEVIKIVASVFAEVFPIIVEVVKVAFEAIALVWNYVLKPVFDFIVFLVKTIYEAVKLNMALTQAVFTAVFGAIKAIWTNVLKPVFDMWVGVVVSLYKTFEKPLNDIKDAFGTCFDWIMGKIQGAIDLVANLIKKAKEVAEFFTGGDSGSSKTTTVSNKTMYHADGGIMTKATLFGMGSDGTRHVGGEAGAEAIIPLSKLPEILEKMGMNSGGGVTVNNYSPNALSVAETARLFKQSQRELALGL